MIGSPALVIPTFIKELRQELRMGSFAFFFAAPQAIAALVLLLQALTSPTASGIKESAEFVFYACLLIPLGFLIPARAVASLSKDAEAGSLQLMSLTRMTTWHITAGKLLALAAISLLFVSALTPYAMLQYFFGGISPLSLLGTIFECWVLSILLSGVVLACAPLRHRGSGFAMFVLWLVALPLLSSYLVDKGGFTGTSMLWSSLTTFLQFMLTALLCCALVVETAANKIAAPTDEFGPRKRVTILVCVGGLAALTLFAGLLQGLTLMCLCFCSIPVVLGSLFENSAPVLARRIARKGGGWRWFVYAGWPAGIVSVCVVEGVVLMTLLQMSTVSVIPFFPLYTILLAGTLAPYAFVTSFRKSARLSFIYYILTQGVFVILIPLATNTLVPGLQQIAFTLSQASLVGFILAIQDSNGGATNGALVSGSSQIVALLFLTGSLMVLFLRFRRLVREARDDA